MLAVSQFSPPALELPDRERSQDPARRAAPRRPPKQAWQTSEIPSPPHPIPRPRPRPRPTQRLAPSHLPSRPPTLAHRSPTATLLFSSPPRQGKGTDRRYASTRRRRLFARSRSVRSARGVDLKQPPHTAFDFLCSAFTRLVRRSLQARLASPGLCCSCSLAPSLRGAPAPARLGRTQEFPRRARARLFAGVPGGGGGGGGAFLVSGSGIGLVLRGLWSCALRDGGERSCGGG